MVTKELSEAAVEFNCILENSSKDIIEKIPTKFLDFLNSIASKTYKFDYEKSKSLNEQKLKPETRGLIALVYQDYICNEDERREYIKKSQLFTNQMEDLKREKYNPDNIFKKQDQVKNTEEVMANEVIMTEYKESIFKKFITKIKNIFTIR